MQERSMLRIVGFAVGLVLAMVMFTPVAKAEGVTYIEIGTGFNDSALNKIIGGAESHRWDDGGAGPFGATIEVGREWDVPRNDNLKVKCRWLHVSQWTVGPPWNDKAESSLDHFGCAARVEF